MAYGVLFVSDQVVDRLTDTTSWNTTTTAPCLVRAIPRPAAMHCRTIKTHVHNRVTCSFGASCFLSM